MQYIPVYEMDDLVGATLLYCLFTQEIKKIFIILFATRFSDIMFEFGEEWRGMKVLFLTHVIQCFS